MKSNEDLVKAWYQKAENDLKNASIVIESNEKEKPFDTICFHCQQAVEKYLKGYLISQNTDFVKTHILEDLLELCIEINKDFSRFEEEVGVLTDYAVEIRYPDDMYVPSESEVMEAYKLACEISEFVNSFQI